MIFVGIRKPDKPIKYFLAHKVDLSPRHPAPEITIVTFQRSSLWRYLMEDHAKFLDTLAGPGYKSPPKVDITFIEDGNLVVCYDVHITGSACFDMDDWPDCKGKIDGRGMWFVATKIKESRIKKKIFLRAEKEFRQERIEGF